MNVKLYIVFFGFYKNMNVNGCRPVEVIINNIENAPDDVVAWVTDHRTALMGKWRKIYSGTPYDFEDFFHDAVVAGYEARAICRAKGYSFKSTYWKVLQRFVSAACYEDTYCKVQDAAQPDDVTDHFSVTGSVTHLIDGDREKVYTLEAIWEAVDDVLGLRERELLAMALGLTFEGTLSLREMAVKDSVKCSPKHVNQIVAKAISRSANSLKL